MCPMQSALLLRISWQMKNKVNFMIQPDFCIALAAAVLFVPLGWLFAWTGAVLIHEIGHYISARLLGCNVRQIQLGASGVKMRTDPMTEQEVLLCALSGPMCGLLTILLIRRVPQLAVCGVLQSAFNLLPILPLDGGRALQSIFTANKRSKLGFRVNTWLTVIVVGLFAVFVLYISWAMKRMIWTVVLLFPLILRMNELNLPCKPVKEKVQYKGSKH